MPLARGERPGPLYDQALRPQRQSAPPHAIPVRDGASGLQAKGISQLQPAVWNHAGPESVAGGHAARPHPHGFQCDGGQHGRSHQELCLSSPHWGKWQLSPAYDVTHAFNPKGEWVNQHLMSVNGKFADITRSDIEAVAERYEMRKLVDPTIEKVKAALDCWPEFAERGKVDQQEVSAIGRDIKKFSEEVSIHR